MVCEITEVPPLERIDSKTLRQKVYERIKWAIITGDVLPGESIAMRSLSEQFGVSVMPIREAMWQLESERIVSITRNKEVCVRRLGKEEMKELTRIRLNLEILVARRACELRPNGAVLETRGNLELLWKSLENPKAYLLCNSKFHLSMYAYAKLPLHLEIIENLWARVSPYISIHLQRTENISKTMSFHEKMSESFRRKDAKSYCAAIRRDIIEAAEVIIPSLEG